MNSAAIEFAKSWNQKWFGFWAEEAELTREPFSLANHVDPTWVPFDIYRLIGYLRDAPLALAAQSPATKCAFCEELESASAYRSDGEWLWPDPLAHLVERHSFVLPNRLVEHIRNKGYTAPEKISIPWQQLPWPGNVGVI